MPLSTFLHRLQHSTQATVRDFALLTVLINTLWLSLPVAPVHSLQEPSTLNKTLIDPYFIESEETYLYGTTFGNYSFSKEDGTYSYTYLDGTRLCPSVQFVMQYLAGDSWEDFAQSFFSLRGLSNEQFAFSVNVLRNASLMGIMDVDCQFFTRQAPKISARFRELKDCKPFRIVFKSTVPQAWRYFVDEQVIEMTQTEYKMTGKERVRVCNQSEMEGALTLLVDWSDFGTTECLLKGSTIRVVFPIDEEEVDPRTVADDTLSIGTNWSCQRKMFYAQSLFWVCYKLNVAQTSPQYAYRTSSDRLTWSDKTDIEGTTHANYLSLFYNGSHVHFAISRSGKLRYLLGEPLSNGTIQWVTDFQNVKESVGEIYSYIGIVTNSTGHPSIIYHESSTDTIKVIKSTLNNGTWSTEFDTAMIDECLDTCQPSLVPLTENKMYALYSDYSGNVILGKLYNGSDWQTEEECTTESFGKQGMSAVAISDIVHMVFMDTSYRIQYVKRDNVTGWASEVTLYEGDSESGMPSVCKSGSNLIVFWHDNRIIYAKRHSAGAWKATETLTDESSWSIVYQHSLSTAYDADQNYCACIYTAHTSLTVVRFQTLGMIEVTISATPTTLETGKQTTVSWTVKYVNGTALSSYTINITRDGNLILQDSSESSLTDTFGRAGVHNYTCSGVTDGFDRDYSSNSLSVEWVGEETRGTGEEDGRTGGTQPTIEEVAHAVRKGLAETGLYWMAGLLAVVIVGGVYAGTKTKRVSRKSRGTTGGGGSHKPRGRAGSQRAQPRGTPKKRRRDARGRFV